MSEKITYAESFKQAAVPILVGALAFIVHYSTREFMSAAHSDATIITSFYGKEPVPVWVSGYFGHCFGCMILAQALTLAALVNILRRDAGRFTRITYACVTAISAGTLVWGVLAQSAVLQKLAALVVKMAGG